MFWTILPHLHVHVRSSIKREQINQTKAQKLLLIVLIVLIGVLLHFVASCLVSWTQVGAHHLVDEGRVRLAHFRLADVEFCQSCVVRHRLGQTSSSNLHKPRNKHVNPDVRWQRTQTETENSSCFQNRLNLFSGVFTDSSVLIGQRWRFVFLPVWVTLILRSLFQRYGKRWTHEEKPGSERCRVRYSLCLAEGRTQLMHISHACLWITENPWALQTFWRITCVCRNHQNWTKKQ